jgi:predicted ABC-type ATPase
MSKNLYIIAGCNGAGKTTASFTILPEILDCHEYVNADEIARGLSPFQDVLIFDNSEGKHELIAKKINHSDILISNDIKFNLLKQQYDSQR